MPRRAGYRQPGLWVALIAIALLAGVARVVAWKALDDAPGFRVPLLDAAVYDRWARAVAAGEGSGTEVFHLAPLYPILCGLIYRSVPDGRTAVFVLQSIAGLVLAVGAGFIAARLVAAREGASWFAACLTAGTLVALSSTLIAYEHALLPEVLGAVLLTAGAGLVALGLAGEGEVRPGRALVAGILLGLDTLVRPTGLLLVGAAAHFLALRWPRRQILAALVLVLGALLTIAPVTIRNRLVAGEWVLVSASGGFNFYVGNHAGADGGYMQPAGVHFVPGDRGDPTGRALAEEAEGRPLTAGEVSRYWRDRSLAFVREDPIAAAALYARKLALVWTVAEIPQILHVAALRRDLPAFGRLPLAGPAVLMPLALLGLVFTVASARSRPGRGFLALLVLAFTAATALFFVTDRYRVQAIPLLAVLAGLGVSEALRHLRSGRAGPIAGVVVAGALSWLALDPRWLGLDRMLGDPWTEPLNRAVAMAKGGADSTAVAEAFALALERGPNVARVHTNRGEWLRSRGDLTAARADFARAVTLDAEDPVAWAGLASVEAALGEPSALGSYDRARALAPDFAPAALGRGQLLLRLGRAEEAIPNLEAALLGADSAAAHDGLGVAYALAGDSARAHVHLHRAVELAPDRPFFLLHLGLFTAESGDPAGAERLLRSAVALDPGFPPARLGLAALYRDRGDRARAERELDTLLVHAPGDSAAYAFREALRSAP